MGYKPFGSRSSKEVFVTRYEFYSHTEIVDEIECASQIDLMAQLMSILARPKSRLLPHI